MVVAAAVFLLAAVAVAQDFNKKFEYQYSFKGPYITQTDGTIPFWSHHGHALAGDDNIRLVPSLRSRQGSVWTKKAFEKDWWEIEVFIRISGRGKVGADGMGIWYTVENGEMTDPTKNVYGAKDQWMGLGIFLDSFDNNGNHDNPKIMAFVNDGTNSYDHANDGGSTALFSCRRDFRNKPYPVRLKIRYYKSTLTIFYHAGVTEFDDYEYCGSSDNVVLEKGFFGMSAATGGLSDDHDVMKFLTHSITDPESKDAQPDVEEQEEIQKLEEEMKQKVDELNVKFTEDKTKFAEENPELAPQENLDIGSDDPQLQLIFTVQNHIQQNIKTIASDIASVKEMIDMLPAKISVPQAPAAAVEQKDPPSPGLPVQSSKEAVDAIRVVDGKTTQMTNDLNALRQELSKIANAVASIQAQPKQPAAGNPAQSIEEAQFKKSQQDLMSNLRQDIQTMTLKIGNIERQKSQCPKMPEVSCVSSSTFVFLTLLQICVIAFLVHYKMSQEAQAKKFF